MRLSLLGYALLSIVLIEVGELQWRKRGPLVRYTQVHRTWPRHQVLVYIQSKSLVCSLRGHSIPWSREERAD